MLLLLELTEPLLLITLLLGEPDRPFPPLVADEDDDEEEDDEVPLVCLSLPLDFDDLSLIHI